jgi:hypothetical protein
MRIDRRTNVEERRAIHDLLEGANFGGLDEFCEKLTIIGDQCQAKTRLCPTSSLSTDKGPR